MLFVADKNKESIIQTSSEDALSISTQFLMMVELVFSLSTRNIDNGDVFRTAILTARGKNAFTRAND